MRHIFGFFTCFLALNHFFIKVAMQRGAEDTLRSHSLVPNLSLELYSASFWRGQKRGRQSGGHGPPLTPLCLSLYAAPCQTSRFLGAEMAFLSSVGSAHGTNHPALYADFMVSQVVESVTSRKEEGQQSPQQQARIFGRCTSDTQRTRI